MWSAIVGGSPMIRALFALAVVLFVSTSMFAAEGGGVIDTMDAATFAALPKMEEKVKVEVVEGQAGKALQFSFVEGSKGAFATRRARPLATPEWDQAAGIS